MSKETPVSPAGASSSQQQQQPQHVKRTIVPVQVQRSIMEWLDEDLPHDSPARTQGGKNAHSTLSGSSKSASATTMTMMGRNRSNSPTRKRATRRQKVKEHWHVFVENPNLPAVHPANSIWLYGSFEYKLQIKPEDAQRTVFRTITRLVEKMNKLLDASTAAMARGDDSKEKMAQAARDAEIDAMMPQPPSQQLAAENEKPAVGTLAREHPLHKTVSEGGFRAKGHLIFDIISTRKHITKEFKEGLPYRLGEEVYEFTQRKFMNSIATCFVGLTDNPAQRAGRDVFYQRTDDLSTERLDFDHIDYSHLFVVFPPDKKKVNSGPQQQLMMNSMDPSASSSSSPSPTTRDRDGQNNRDDEDEEDGQTEELTRFLVYARSGIHDLTGSAIPGRPPPISSLRASNAAHQQQLRMVQQQHQLQQQQKMLAARHGTTTASSSGRAASAESLGMEGEGFSKQDASQMINMYQSLHGFTNSPRQRAIHSGGGGNAAAANAIAAASATGSARVNATAPRTKSTPRKMRQ